MLGVQSFADSFAVESEWNRRQWEADHMSIYAGTARGNAAANGEAAMRDMIAGDVRNEYYPPKQSSTLPAMLGVGLLAAATGVGGALLWDRLNEPATTPPTATEPAEHSDRDTFTDVTFPNGEQP
jgi:hypothetical protein